MTRDRGCDLTALRERALARGQNKRRADRGGTGAQGPSLASPFLHRAARWLLGAAALAALGGGGYQGWLWATHGAFFRVATLRFTGLARASRDDLVRLSPVRAGENIWTADLDAAARAMEKDPWVKSARISRELPATLAVAVVEREPAALIDLGGLYLVDEDGEVFKRARPGDGLDLPVVTGFTRDDYVQRRHDVDALLQGALALLKSYAEQGLGELAPVSELHVDADQGVTLYVGDAGTQVRLGAGDLPQKLDKLHSILEALRKEGLQAQVLYLDNRARPSWVTVRLPGAGEAQRQGRAPKGAP